MPRLINAPLHVHFEEYDETNLEIEREYNLLSESDEDPVGQWLKIAKARGDTRESDQVLLTLIVELHRKVDDLSAYIRNEHVNYLTLDKDGRIDNIGYENFQMEEDILVEGKKYYGRISMPVFPKREIPLFFTAQSSKLASITRLHERDQNDWNAYFTARERVLIREMRSKKDGK